MQNVRFETQYNEIMDTVQYLCLLHPVKNVVDKVAMGQLFLQVL
jgi:hypothetical protein